MDDLDTCTDRINLKGSVFSNFIESSREYINKICSDKGNSTWTELWNKLRNDNDKEVDNSDSMVGKQHKSALASKEKDIRSEGSCNGEELRDGVCKWEITCCQIKMQDPCEACCCEMYEKLPDPCPDGLLPRKKHATCQCEQQPTNCAVHLEKA